ncbi:PASTA domain-containing protein [Cellulomonas sp. PhB150]|uniref:PASTA domain-containing protein n=1 Tax=Cellulomonas sp. PhB150 TaxID=2485188 RepID=UPI000F48CC81|nr:PASTA domain-containing protein [Cellulomonas sp. PhB150]ROS28027.1 hypothetical protein EDF34_1825 [Cellulomonas sp. PhB150]
MKKTITLTAAALLASSLLLAGCSDDSDSDSDAAASPSMSASAAETTAAPTEVEVISQTNLTVDAAQGTFDLLGLTTNIVDEDGKGVVIGDDGAKWLVVSQDPETGTVPVGSAVTLVVRKAS